MSAAPALRARFGAAVDRWLERPMPRLAGFGVALAIALAAGAGLGVALGPDSVPVPAAPASHSTTAH